MILNHSDSQKKYDTNHLADSRQSMQLRVANQLGRCKTILSTILLARLFGCAQLLYSLVVDVTMSRKRRHCSISNCASRTLPDDEVSFRGIPKGAELVARWQPFLTDAGLNHSSRTVVCSLHFGDDQFQPQKRLRADAVPTIVRAFGWKVRVEDRLQKTFG